MKISNKNTIRLTPQWVTGFTDAEGNFSINYSQKTGKISVSFKVTQKSHSANVLIAFKEFFGCGNVYSDNKKFDAFKFQVSNKNIIKNKIIPHFDKYQLVSSKNLDYLSFKRCIELLDNKNANLKAILSIKKSMNNGRSSIDRFNYFSTTSHIQIDPRWLQGFIDGEGCFYSYMGKNNTYINTLEISQSFHEIKLLEAIRIFFKLGSIKPKCDIDNFFLINKNYKYTFKISDTKAVISFISEHNMLTRKHLDYLDWVRMVKLKKSKAYKTDHGLKLMREIKQGMNSGRNDIAIDTVKSKLFDFAFGSLVFVIMVVAFIANGINEEDTVDTQPCNNYDNYYDDLESENNDSEHKVLLWYDGLTESEVKLVEIQVKNLANFYENSKVEVVRSNEGNSLSDIHNIISLIKGITPDNVTSSEIEMSEEAIREIRSGNSPTFWIQNDDDSESLKDLKRLSRQSDSDTMTLNVESCSPPEIIDSITADDRPRPKRIIMLTQPAGDAPAPLPSWTILPPAPSEDSPDRSKWLRDVAERKYWCNRLDSLNAELPLEKVDIDERTVKWILNTPSDVIPNDEVKPEDVPIPYPSISESELLQGDYIIDSKGQRVYDSTEETSKSEKDSLATLDKNSKK